MAAETTEVTSGGRSGSLSHRATTWLCGADLAEGYLACAASVGAATSVEAPSAR